MKKYFLILSILLLAATAFTQSTFPIRADTVLMYKVGGETFLKVLGKGSFSDTLTITTMGDGDSSNRAASTKFVKRLHTIYNSDGVLPTDRVINAQGNGFTLDSTSFASFTSYSIPDDLVGTSITGAGGFGVHTGRLSINQGADFFIVNDADNPNAPYISLSSFTPLINNTFVVNQTGVHSSTSFSGLPSTTFDIYQDSLVMAKFQDSALLILKNIPSGDNYSRILAWDFATGKIGKTTGSGLFWPTSGAFALKGTVTGNNGGHDFTLSGTHETFLISDTTGFSSIADDKTKEKTVILNHSSNAVMAWLNEAETRRNFILVDSTGVAVSLATGKIFRGGDTDSLSYIGASYVQRDWVLARIGGGGGSFWPLTGDATFTGNVNMHADGNGFGINELNTFSVSTSTYTGGMLAISDASGTVLLGDADGDVNNTYIGIDDSENLVTIKSDNGVRMTAHNWNNYNTFNLVDSGFVGGVYSSILDSTQLGYAPTKLLYGQIYSHNTWPNLNAFTIGGGGSWTISGGKIVVSGGTSDFTKTLQVSTTDKGTNGNTNLRHWTAYVRAKVTSLGNGFAIGIKSNTINGNYNISARLSTSTGNTYIEGGLNSTSLFATSASAISISLNDYVEVSLNRNDYVLTANVRNVTANGASVPTSYTYVIPTDNMPNNGLFSLYNISGGWTVDSLSFSSESIVNSDVLVLADSKADYSATVGYSFPALLQTNHFETTPSAGGFETTAEWESRTEEIIQLNPVAAIMCNPSNDGATSVNVDSTKARYYRIERALRDAGIQVYHSNGFYETRFTPSAWATYIEATRSADSIIYTYETSAGLTGTGVNGFLAVDGIHPTTAGHSLVYNTITQSFKLKNGKGLPPAGSGTIYIPLSPSTQTDGFINISGNGAVNTIANPTSLGSGTATSSIPTVALRIKTQSNSNEWLYGNGGNNFFYSADNNLTGFVPLKIGSSTLDILVGSGGSTNALAIDASANSIFGGKVFLGGSFSGSVVFKATGETNHTLQYFYNGSRDNIFFSNNGLTAGTAATIAADGLNLDTYSSGGVQTNRVNIVSNGDVSIPSNPLNIGTSTSAASAAMQIVSTTKGFLPPAMTTTQMNAISSPATGLEISNSTTTQPMRYDGSAWRSSAPITGSFSQVGTATTVFTVTFGGTQPNSTYTVNVTPTAALSAALFYVTNKTTTTFDVTYLAGLTGTVTFDWSLNQ